jgi:hypothetical protein
VLFDPGADLNVVSGHNDIYAWLAVGHASGLQIFVDDEADDHTESQRHSPNHQQPRTVHSHSVGTDKDIPLTVDVASGALALLRRAESY